MFLGWVCVFPLNTDMEKVTLLLRGRAAFNPRLLTMKMVSFISSTLTLDSFPSNKLGQIDKHENVQV